MNLLILFFYIYPIIFIGLPLSTRILYALGGVFLFICQRFIDKRLFSVWWGLVPVALCSVGSGILNLTFVFFFVLYMPMKKNLKKIKTNKRIVIR